MTPKDRPTIIILSSVHDYRMARRGSIQAIADAFMRAGFRTIFLSVRFSPLSFVKGDPRSHLAERANRLESVDGVECYLWRTPFHPFRTGGALGDKITEPLHDVFAAWPNGSVDALLAQADVVMVESGLGVLLLPRIRRLNPTATVLYRASDPLDVIGAHPVLQARLEQYDPLIDHYCLLASGMAPWFGFARDKTYVVPQAINLSDFEQSGPNPFPVGSRNAVSVGSMLFDASFFDAAARAAPDVTFHAIGCGAAKLPQAENVRVYPEMAFRDIVPFMRHSDVGIAPYRAGMNARYLGESSLKLTQFAHLRRPAVCPYFAVGDHPHRFGYTPGDATEIERALRAALADTFGEARTPPLTWDDTVQRFLRPRDFADAYIPDAMFDASVTRSSGAAPQAADDLAVREAKPVRA